jgi:putative ABC transport system ATP-binding protein
MSEAPKNQPLVEIDSVVKIFRTPAGDFPALRGVSAQLYPGEFVSIVGKSGSGKSTLANMITGIDHPTSGSVRVGGVEIHRMSESDMSIWRGRSLGIVFQFFQLLPMLTLLENVLLPMDLAGKIPPEAREPRGLELLRAVGLEDYADHLPGEVAGGQQQVAAIARALANDPPLIIADEPTGNLDSRTAEAVFGIFEGLAAQGKTLLMVTHDPGLAARTGRILHIADGELVAPPEPAPEPAEPARPRLPRLPGILDRLVPVFAARRWRR